MSDFTTPPSHKPTAETSADQEVKPADEQMKQSNLESGQELHGGASVAEGMVGSPPIQEHELAQPAADGGNYHPRGYAQEAPMAPLQPPYEAVQVQGNYGVAPSPYSGTYQDHGNAPVPPHPSNAAEAQGAAHPPSSEAQHNYSDATAAYQGYTAPDRKSVV